MKRIYILNGPNMNMLGIREPSRYGNASYRELVKRIRLHGKSLGVSPFIYQSNHEGDLVDQIHRAYFDKSAIGIVINPGAYTHTSIALLDAVKAVKLPTVEVHITDVDNREDFRKISYIREACVETISGHGIDGYLEAMDHLVGGLLCK